MQQFLVISDTHNKLKCAPRFLYMREHYPNHKLIIPGDIVNDGEWGQYSYMRAWLESWEFYPCPGNHDVGHTGLFDFFHKLQDFDNAFNTDYATSKLPRVSIVDNVALIGLNSNPGSWGWWLDFARGKIGKEQLRWLEMDLAACADMVRIVFCHHHITMRNPFMELKDARELRAILAGHCEVVLTGHRHRQEILNIAGVPLAYAAGAFYRETEALEITVEGKKVTHKMVPII